MKRALVVLSSIALVLLAGEVGFRLFGAALGVDQHLLDRYQNAVSGEVPAFEPRPHTVFARPPGRRFANALGFSDVEWTLEKTPGVARIACLGASTTESGNDARREGSFPYRLELQLERRTGRGFEVMNCGISGWTSAESLVSWFLTIQDFRPDLVIVHHAVNDVPPRNRDGFRTDYSHWRHPWQLSDAGSLDRLLVRWSRLYAWLFRDPARLASITEQTTLAPRGPTPFERSGRLPAGSEAPFRRNVESIGLSAASGGADVLLLTMPINPARVDDWPFPELVPGVREHNRILRDLAREHAWLLVDAARWFEENPAATEGTFRDLVHLAPEGNRLKAERIVELLIAEWSPARPLRPSEEQAR